MPPRKRTRKPREVYDPNAVDIAARGSEAAIVDAEIEAEHEAAEVRKQAREQRAKRPSKTADMKERARELAALTSDTDVEMVEHGESLFVVRFPVYVDPALGTVNRRYTVQHGRIFPSMEAFEFAETIALAIPRDLHNLCWVGPCAFSFAWYRSVVSRSGDAARFDLPVADTDGPIKSAVDVFAPPKNAKRPLPAASVIADDHWTITTGAVKAPTHGRPRMDVAIVLGVTVADVVRVYLDEHARHVAQVVEAFAAYDRDREQAARAKRDARAHARRAKTAIAAGTPFAAPDAVPVVDSSPFAVDE
jgi:hypothetical protein